MRAIEGIQNRLTAALGKTAVFERLCPRPPPREKTWDTRVAVSGTLLVMYLIAAQLPLLGVTDISQEGSTWKQMLGVKGGTWMALGVDPIITAGLLFKLVVAAGIVRVDTTKRSGKRDEELLQTLAALGVTVWQLSWYVYESVEWKHDHVLEYAARVSLVVLQLVPLNVFFIMFDNATSQGFGLAAASSLYITTSTVTSVLWKTLSPFVTPSSTPEGALPALAHGAWSDGAVGLLRSSVRTDGANLVQLLITVVLIVMATILQNAQVELATKRSSDPKNHAQPYGIKLMHTAETPVVLYSMVSNQFNSVSQLLWQRYGAATSWIGEWERQPETGQLFPVKGVAQWIDPKSWYTTTTFEMAAARIAVYAVCTVSACVAFSLVWARLDGLSGHGVAHQFAQQKVTLVGHREASTRRFLCRYISAATVWSGLVVGTLLVLTEVYPPLTSAVSLFIAVNTLEKLGSKSD